MITDFDTRDRLRKAGYPWALSITQKVKFDPEGNRSEQWTIVLLDNSFSGPDLNVATWLAEQHLKKESK